MCVALHSEARFREAWRQTASGWSGGTSSCPPPLYLPRPRHPPPRADVMAQARPLGGWRQLVGVCGCSAVGGGGKGVAPTDASRARRGEGGGGEGGKEQSTLSTGQGGGFLS